MDYSHTDRSRNQPFISHMFLTFQVDTQLSLAASGTAGRLVATVREIQLGESLVVEEVYFSTAKSNRSSSTPGRNCDSITPSAHNRRSHDKIERPSGARGQLHVSRPLHAQLPRPFYPTSLASCHTPPKHCESPEHEHLLSRCVGSPQLSAPAILAQWSI